MPDEAGSPDAQERGWIWRLRAQVLLGITLAPVIFAAVALPWGLIQVATAPAPDREIIGTVVGTDRDGRSTCVKVVEYTVDGRTYRTESNVNSSLYCDIGSGGEEVVHYESDDPSHAYAGDISTEQEGSWLVAAGLGALAVAVAPGLVTLLDYVVFRARRRAR